MTASTLAQNPATAGEPDRWDAKWRSGSQKLFTRGRPRTTSELCHQTYFMDLWFNTLHYANPSFCELGAGRGTTAQYLASRGSDVTLVDMSEAGFRQARINFADEGMAAPHCVIADVEALPFGPNQFDCVYSIGLLEHFEDASEVIKETHRVLKPGGIMWHIVLDGLVFKTSDVFRAEMDETGLMLKAVDAGFSNSDCKHYRFKGVYLLSGVKP